MNHGEHDGKEEAFLGVGHAIPGEPNNSTVDKLIDINYYLVGRVQELEEIVKAYMQRQVEEKIKRMNER